MTLQELIERAQAKLRGSDYDFEKALPYFLSYKLLTEPPKKQVKE